jgi:antitoxin ParD1/3/4
MAKSAIKTKGLIMSLNISLPPELENRVRSHVASGMFTSASEVIREALRLFESYHSVQGATLAALKADIAQGLDDHAAARIAALDMTSIKAEGRRVFAARTTVS